RTATTVPAPPRPRRLPAPWVSPPDDLARPGERRHDSTRPGQGNLSRLPRDCQVFLDHAGYSVENGRHRDDIAPIGVMAEDGSYRGRRRRCSLGAGELWTSGSGRTRPVRSADKETKCQREGMTGISTAPNFAQGCLGSISALLLVASVWSIRRA